MPLFLELLREHQTSDRLEPQDAFGLYLDASDHTVETEYLSFQHLALYILIEDFCNLLLGSLLTESVQNKGLESNAPPSPVSKAMVLHGSILPGEAQFEPDLELQGQEGVVHHFHVMSFPCDVVFLEVWKERAELYEAYQLLEPIPVFKDLLNLA